jgi:hypothetical protein
MSGHAGEIYALRSAQDQAPRAAAWRVLCEDVFCATYRPGAR